MAFGVPAWIFTHSGNQAGGRYPVFEPVFSFGSSFQVLFCRLKTD